MAKTELQKLRLVASKLDIPNANRKSTKVLKELIKKKQNSLKAEKDLETIENTIKVETTDTDLEEIEKDLEVETPEQDFETTDSDLEKEFELWQKTHPNHGGSLLVDGLITIEDDSRDAEGMSPEDEFNFVTTQIVNHREAINILSKRLTKLQKMIKPKEEKSLKEQLDATRDRQNALVANMLPKALRRDPYKNAKL